MTTLFLVRHAAHDLLGRVLTGRMAGVRLGEAGRRQCGRLAERLAGDDIAAVYTSPLERARETAAPLAARHGLDPLISEGIAEVDYGEWSGLAFTALDGDPRWPRWNAAKATERPPGGESLLDVQWRAVTAVEAIVAAHPERGAALVSHGDVIKVVLAYYLGLAIEGIARFAIDPASVSTLSIGPAGAIVRSVNEPVAP